MSKTEGLINGSLLWYVLRAARKQGLVGDGEYGSPDDLEWLEDAVDPNRMYHIMITPEPGEEV